jgi:hypothetical protein
MILIAIKYLIIANFVFIEPKKVKTTPIRFYIINNFHKNRLR